MRFPTGLVLGGVIFSRHLMDLIQSALCFPDPGAPFRYICYVCNMPRKFSTPLQSQARRFLPDKAAGAKTVEGLKKL